MTQITPNLQGRVFAANSLVLQVVSAIVTLIAGPLADYILEPAMQPEYLWQHFEDESWCRHGVAVCVHLDRVTVSEDEWLCYSSIANGGRYSTKS